jgi:6-phosphogluconolactonase
VRERGRFLLALSGGRTPITLVRRLASPPWIDRIAWEATHIFWSDERCVPPTDPASNAGAAMRAGLDRVPIPAENVHRIEGDRPPIDAADRYEAALREILGPNGRLDLCLLGLGDDGHTASLFPRHQALREKTRWVLAVHTSAEPPWRVTMTLPLINRSREVLFLVSGREKAAAFRRVRAGDDLPAAHVAAENLAWLVDRAAICELNPPKD